MFDPRDDARDRDEREDGRARVYDERDREDDPREGLMRDLDLPRGDERELVVVRDQVHELDGEDSRTLGAVGAFRVVPEHDFDIDHDTLEHLRDDGLVEMVDLGDDERGLAPPAPGPPPHAGSGSDRGSAPPPARCPLTSAQRDSRFPTGTASGWGSISESSACGAVRWASSAGAAGAERDMQWTCRWPALGVMTMTSAAL